MLKPHYVVSSTIDCIGYQMSKMYVRFLSGATYSYDAVPYDLYDGLKKAESCGQFLHRFIKKANFHYNKLDNDPFLST